MLQGISIDNLIHNSTFSVWDYYNSDKVKAYSVGVKVFLPCYYDAEHHLLTNKYFNIHLDLSKRYGYEEIDAIDLTPRITEAGGFIKWLRETCGQRFVEQYYREIYHEIEKEHAEKIG